MLAIGRALMSKPRLLILDEPSLGLAPLIVKQIFNIIREIRSLGLAVLLVEQNARQALGVADFGYVFEVGRAVLSGPAAELSSNAEVQKDRVRIATDAAKRWNRRGQAALRREAPGLKARGRLSPRPVKGTA